MVAWWRQGRCDAVDLMTSCRRRLGLLLKPSAVSLLASEVRSLLACSLMSAGSYRSDRGAYLCGRGSTLPPHTFGDLCQIVVLVERTILTEVSFYVRAFIAHCLAIADAESGFKSLLVIQRRARWLQLAIAVARISSDFRTWTVVKLVRTGVTCWRLGVETRVPRGHSLCGQLFARGNSLHSTALVKSPGAGNGRCLCLEAGRD